MRIEGLQTNSFNYHENQMQDKPASAVQEAEGDKKSTVDNAEYYAGGGCKLS